MFAPVYTVKSSSFPGAWETLVKRCIDHGIDINFGGPNEQKIAREIVGIAIIEGEGIDQIFNRELHSKVQFKGRALDAYVDEEYTYEFAYHQNELPDDSNEKHPYSYMERFVLPVDQIEKVREGIAFQQEYELMSNRIQMITWDSKTDSFKSASPPCLQRIWIRWGLDNFLDIHLDWRSRDLFDAWTSNLIGLTGMVDRYIAQPLGCKIGRVMDKSDSLHIYKRNWEAL